MGGRRQWAKTESNRITVAECFACPIWIIAKRRCSIASDHPHLARVYEYAIDQFIAWYCSNLDSLSTRLVVVRYRMYLESRRLAANTINQQLAAVK